GERICAGASCWPRMWDDSGLPHTPGTSLFKRTVEASRGKTYQLITPMIGEAVVPGGKKQGFPR
ncbi:MAG: hypothetical protein LBF93_09230, partial [Zoogloeaceae bacterium]|nr:hypothetical protein [Zoogloeaceae bacterium]